jgi:hypothetical protein
MMLFNKPRSPTPEGPSITAMAFTRAIPIRMLMTDEAPMIEVESSI